MEKASDINFERATNANAMCLPKNIENLDEILKGINRLAWMEENKSFGEWFKENARYKEEETK